MKIPIILLFLIINLSIVLGKMHKRNRKKTLAPTHYNLTPDQFPLFSQKTPRNTSYNIDIILITESNKTTHPVILNTITTAQSKLESIILSDISPGYNYSTSKPCYNNPLFKLATNITLVDDLLIFILITNKTSVASGGPCFISPDKFPRVGMVLFNKNLFEELSYRTNDTTSMKFMSDVFLHEFLHVIGIGTLWHHLLLPLRPAQPVKYAGAKGVENYHGYLRGTGDLLIETHFNNMGDHFDECAYDDEIMTPVASDVNYLSTMTCSALLDLNYTIDINKCDTNWQLPKKVPCDSTGFRLASQFNHLNLTNDALPLPPL